MKAVHIVPAITEEASGPSYSVPRLCHALLDQGVDVTLLSLDWDGKGARHDFQKTFPLGHLPGRLGSSPKMYQWLRGQAAGSAAIFHTHGMWQFNALYPAWVTRRSHCKLVVSPRGALSPWALANGSRAKRLFWPLLQRPALEAAACFHATAESEYEDIRRLGFSQPVAIIPNGIDIPDGMEHIVGKAKPRTLLFLARIHPVKGLDLLLEAWGEIVSRFVDWRLLIVGSDKGYDKGFGYLGKIRELASHCNGVEFAGELSGEKKWRAYREAELYVLPTRSENFGVTVAEALAVGTPVVTTRGAPWRGVETHGAGWWVDVSSDALRETLELALALPPEQLKEMGEHGREWMRREYSWASIGEKMSETYRWLMQDNASPPAWIRVD